MSLITPLSDPDAFNTFTLDKDVCPGIAEILSGGGRKREIQDQQQPGTTGANTVRRGRNLVSITYGFKLWLPEHFAKMAAWYAMLEAGDLTKDPRVYKYQDLRRLNVRQVIYEADEALKTLLAGGPYQEIITFHEYNKVKQLSVAAPPASDQAKVNAAIAADSADMRRKLDAAAAGGRAGK